MSNPNYRVVYNVVLLDDLHNYFPSLLYQPHQFTTVASVLNYVRVRTMERFNLFNVGEGLFLNSLGAIPTNTVHQARAPEAPLDINIEIEEMGPGTGLGSIGGLGGLGGMSAMESALLPLLRTLYQPTTGLGNQTTFFRQPFGVNGQRFQDVVVRPTQAQIDAGSTLRTLEADSADNCAICQDRMRAEEEIRHLTGCNHDFHRACIDNWYERSVLCPTCRHDIRGPARTTPTLGPQPTPSPSTNQTNAVPQTSNAPTNATTAARRPRETADAESAILRMLFPNMQFL